MQIVRNILPSFLLSEIFIFSPSHFFPYHIRSPITCLYFNINTIFFFIIIYSIIITIIIVIIIIIFIIIIIIAIIVTVIR